MQEVAHLGVLGVHIELVFLITGHLYGFPTYDLQAEAVDAAYLQRIVGHEYEVLDAEVGKDACSCTILTKVGSEAECNVCLYCVHALVLQVVGAELVYQSYAPAFLTQVEEHAPTLLLYAAHGFGKLFAAVAAKGAKGIAGETL